MTFLYNIFGYVLRELYELVDSYGLALILLTFLARLIMLPSSIKQQQGTAKMQRLQSKVRKIQQQYEGDQRKIQEETQALYSREGYNPMGSGCLPLLLQLPIIYGLIGVIYKPLTYVLNIPEDVVAKLTKVAETVLDISAKNNRTIELSIIGNIDKFKDYLSPEIFKTISDFDFEFLSMPLGETPSVKQFNILWIVPVLSFVSNLASSLFMYLRQRETNPAMAKNPSMGCMTFGMPLFSLFFTFQFPVGVGVYWIASSLIAFVQTVILNLIYSPKKTITRLMVDETVQRRSKEENIKRMVSATNKQKDRK
ncbi:MAG: YidC/Oxa1 family membrane protein insertase [Clostridia bacterium]|nr:YidC/Oxa1 family membrane protein insertase [Clostridia bacterium]